MSRPIHSNFDPAFKSEFYDSFISFNKYGNTPQNLPEFDMRRVGAKDNFLVIKKKKRKQVLLPEFSLLGHRCPLYLGVTLVREMRPADIDTQLCGPSCFKTGSNGKSELGARDSSTQRGSQGLWVIYLFGGRAKLSRKII